MEAITNDGIDVEISADGGAGSWEMENEMTEGELAKWIRASRLGPTWDCYQAVAKALLAMPIPAGE